MPLPHMSRMERDAYFEALSIIENARKNGERTLKMGVMGLTYLPPEIGQLTELTSLDLSLNRLIHLPPEIGKLSALTELILSDNRLAALPPEIGQLTALIQLFINDNQLATLPPEIGQLPVLANLSLHSNRLAYLPRKIGHLCALTKLFLGSNKLTYLPPDIGQLATLKALHLSDNRLATLPPEIGQLTALKELSLSHNQLASLPPEIGRLPSLTSLYLHENPRLGIPESILGPTIFEEIIDEITRARPEDILDFYFKSIRGEKRALNEVKLLLVGRGEAGKTSVSRALRGAEFDAAQKETPGIEIEPWDLKCPGADDVKVYLWDFAGQEITHETHRFFLTERSLYVVVLDGRGGQQMEEAEYWLSHVQRYGTSYRSNTEPEHSPVIVVLNKWQSPGPYDVEKRRLQREYPNIRAFVETDCKEGYGMDHLRKTLRAVIQEMPSVRREWPVTYYNVRRKLQALAENPDPARRKYFVNWNCYREICEKCGVTELSEQTSMAENLNALGVALYYGDHDRLRDTRVLNPNWVANGLYGLVRGVHRKPYLGKPGYLWAGEFPAVLKEGMEGMNRERGATYEDYPEEREGVKVHDFLMELMQDRELAFLAREEKGQPLYLLPGLLSLDEPEPKDYDIAAHIEGAQVRFRYLYELLPAGVMSRFIVRTHTLSEEYFRWQRGTVLGWGNARALVMSERRRNPRMDVFIIGGTPEERQELAGVVRSNMKVIHRGLPEGLAGKEELDLTLPGEQYESVDKLIRLEEQNLPVQVVTRRGAEEVPVTPQLEQVQPAEARQPNSPELKIFVSYSHADYKVWERFKPYLDILKNDGLVRWWYDGKVREGSDWDDSIRRELLEADVVVLLMSTPFFASPYINGVELTEARRRHQLGKTEILPVLLSPSAAFGNHSWLKKLQTVPSVCGQLRPLTSFNPTVNGWHIVDQALRSMIAGIAAPPSAKR